MSVSVGEKAPDFELPRLGGGLVKLSDFEGKKNVVLFFYPKDETRGCTKEACAFRDAYEDFVAAGAEVIGISSDSIESHARFASRHRLQMMLLSDEGGRVRGLYGIGSMLGVFPRRETFLIDKQGIVRHRFRSQIDVLGHIREPLALLKQLA
jgi:peroxiredoxin Q/BCP